MFFGITNFLGSSLQVEFSFFLWIFYTICDWGVALGTNNFHNFWLNGKKVIMWYIVSFLGQTTWVAKKNHFLKKQKFEIGSLDLQIHEKLWIFPFCFIRRKLWGLLVCGHLRNLYSKINFEVHYLTQFSIFLRILKKNWI